MLCHNQSNIKAASYQIINKVYNKEKEKNIIDMQVK